MVFKTLLTVSVRAMNEVAQYQNDNNRSHFNQENLFANNIVEIFRYVL